ncbi:MULTISPECIES: alpha/beta hydrolase [unclassified Neptuniibacter]|uniref:alpha/beta hydrolase n=1 Tax=unclassified Neptuniibacter TaxID=2630693 RepID=UPI0025E0F019|nr:MULTISPECIES: alpha/beta hydrolase [unclassified Neptuniibacter]
MNFKKLYIHKVILLLSFFSLHACAIDRVKTKNYGGATVEVHKDIPYGPDSAHKFDVYTRDGLNNAPVIFMVHGGAWKMGDKESKSVIQNKIERWLPAGFVFISINYRLLPRASDPVQQAEDVRNALITAQQQASNWGANPEKFILMGHSAGAHLVGLVSSSVGQHVRLGGKRWLGSALLDSAVLDVPSVMNQRHYGFYDDAFGKDSSFWIEASPYHQLKADAPPLLITCSSSRKGACSQANAFSAKANSLGVRASVVSKDLSHKEMNEDLGDNNDYTVKVESFLSSLDTNTKSAISNQSAITEEEPKKGLIRRWIDKRRASE